MIRADGVEITTICENWIDMLLPDQSVADGIGIQRFGLVEHFDPKIGKVQAENGLSLHVRVRAGRSSLNILFDAGLTSNVMLHNCRVLGLDLAEIDVVVISHGHPDHYGEITSLLGGLPARVPVVSHPDAFLPRFAVMNDGRVSNFYNAPFSSHGLAAAGGDLVLTKTPLELGLGSVTTGEIPRPNEFEAPKSGEALREPGLYQVSPNGKWQRDEVWDEQALVIHMQDHGLVVLTGCAHAGVLNTISRAVELTGEDRIAAVLGGFHLGFPTTPEGNVSRTVEGLQRLQPQVVMPMHCSGRRAHAAIAAAFPLAYVQPAVGTRLFIGNVER